MFNVTCYHVHNSVASLQLDTAVYKHTHTHTQQFYGSKQGKTRKVKPI